MDNRQTDQLIFTGNESALSQHKTIIKPPASFSLHLEELWRYRELLYFFTWRDIKVKYRQTVLGFLWVILQPLALMLLFTLVFSRTSIAPAASGLRYEIFILSALVLWTFFQSAVSHASESMIANAGIIKKIYFPRLLIPVSALLSAAVDFAIAFALLLVACLVFRQPLHVEAVYAFPAAILICLFAAFGLGALLGALNVKYRDFRYALPFLLQFLFFGTQVIYPAAIITHPLLRIIFALNPVNAAAELFRAGLGLPPDPQLLIIGTASAIVLAIVGLFYFQKTETFFADIL